MTAPVVRQDPATGKWTVENDTGQLAGPFDSEVIAQQARVAIMYPPPVGAAAALANGSSPAPAPPTPSGTMPDTSPGTKTETKQTSSVSVIPQGDPLAPISQGDTGISKHAPVLVAGAVAVAFFAMLLIMSFHTVPSDNKDLEYTLLGVLATAFVNVCNYYFGSNRASKAKDSAIVNLSK